MKRCRYVAVALFLLFAGSGLARPAGAATQVVTSLLDGFPVGISLRQAITNAAPGDTIRFAVTGTISLFGGPLTINKALIIEGPGPDQLTVSGSNVTTVFTNDTSGQPVTISGLTIANGSTNNSVGGGGIANGGYMTLNNCIITGNRVLPNQQAPGPNTSGGGIFNTGQLFVNNCQITGNSADFGGGLYNFAFAQINNSTISGNSALYGGGIGVDNGLVNIFNSTINNNTATGSGGGLSFGARLGVAVTVAESSLVNVTVSGNQAVAGGGVYVQNMPVIFGASTIANNKASSSGGGGFNAGSTSLTTTIVAGNTAGQGPDWSGPIRSEGYNLIGNTNGVTPNNIPNTVPGFGDLNSTDRQNVDAKLGPLNDNGGPTRTHAPLGDSPALDAAIIGQRLQTLYTTYPTILGATLADIIDQRGLPRFADANGDSNSQPDIGAVEVQSPVIDANGPATGSNFSASFTEDGGPVAIVDSSALTVTNQTGLPLQSATIRLQNRPDGNAESLAITVTPGITSTYNAATGELLLLGNASVATYQQALRSLVYNNASQNPDTSIRNVVFILSNGVSSGQYAGADISVTAVNDAPVNTAPGAVSTPEDTPLAFAGANAIAVADVDVAAGQLQVALGVTNGTLTLGGTTGLTFTLGDGTADANLIFSGTPTALNTALAGMTFTPTANLSGGATLAMVTNDAGNTGNGGPKTASSSIAITIAPVNDAPANTVPGAQTIAEDMPLVFTNAIGVADIDANVMQITLTATHGTLTLGTTNGLTFSSGDGTADSTLTFGGTLAAVNTALNGLTFTPAANYNGAAILTVQSNDGGNTGSGGALTDSDSIAISVTPVNDAPVASDDSYAVSGSGAFSVTAPGVLGNDSDVESNALSAANVSDPSHGTLSLNADGSFTYTPELGFNGVDGFTYRAGDGALASNVATVTLNVSGNTPPPPVPTPAPLTVSFAFPTNNAVLNSLPRIAGLTSSSNNSVSILIQRRSDRKYFNGIAFDTPRVLLPAQVLADGRWVLPGGLLPTREGLADGSYILSAIAADASGNTATETIVIILDRQAPTVTIGTPAPGARLIALPSLSGTASDAANGGGLDRVIVQLRRLSDGAYWTGKEWSRVETGLTATLRGLSWVYRGTLPTGNNLRPGAYRLQVVAVDRAGNRGAAQNTFTVVVSGRNSSTLSPVRLSGFSTSVARNALFLRFSGALDAATATAIENYVVTVDGVTAKVESATYDAATSLVTLQLASGTLTGGDGVIVRYNVQDRTAQEVTGQVWITAR